MTYPHNDYDPDLSYLDAPMEASPMPEGQPDETPLPDGTYQCYLWHTRIVTSEKLSYPALSLKFVELHPPVGITDGRIAELFQVLDPDPKRLPYTKALLACLWSFGSPPKPSDLPRSLAAIIDRCYEVKVKTNASNGKQYRNVYVQKYLDGVHAPARVADDQLPF
jgi:hypothetical protein